MSFYYSRLANEMYPLNEGAEYPEAGPIVDGLDVKGESIPNYSSISATLTDYEVLPGIREVPFSDFTDPKYMFSSKDDWDRSKALAGEISESGWVDPLIIVIDEEGPYILEGGHRFVALGLYLGKESFPALVVKDLDVMSEARVSIMELISRNEPTGDPEYILAYRDSVWFLNTDENGEIDAEVLDEIEDAGIDFMGSDIHGIEDALLTNPRPDVLLGWIDESGSRMYLLASTSDSSLDPKTSPLAKKVAQHLNLRSIVRNPGTDDLEDVTTFRSELKGEIPAIVYHGTSSVYLDNILRTGLRPDEAPSNWIGKYHEIVHPDLVFFSSKIDKATFHAAHTAGETNGDPVILALAIPDKNKMVPDYDISQLDVALGSEMKMSNLAGVWGYEGNIFPGHIKEVHVNLYSDNYRDKFESIKEGGFTELTDKEEIQNYINYKDPYYDPSEFEDDE